jgi:hypothetical protein
MEDDNAAAMVAGGKKLLIVDVDFLDRLNSRAGTKWAAIQVIAHEVGHHIAGFSQSSHENELNADYWSGYILNRLGAAKDASTKAILTVGTDQDTPSHPNKHRRASTIAIGWDNGAAGSVDYEYCDGCE